MQRCSLWFFVALQLGLGTAFQQKSANSVAFRSLETGVQRHATCLRQTALDHQTAWNQKYEELVSFYKEHGHLKVEYKSSMYNWIINQRKKRASNGNHASLTDEQIRSLDEIDFPWTPNSKSDWQTRYNELANFYNTRGHTNVEYKSSLYNWIINQRTKRTGGKGSNAPLSEEQIRLLDKLDFQWTTGKDKLQTEWNEKYKKLACFYEEQGHSNLKCGSNLYWWTVVQRRKRQSIKNYAPLSNEQIQLLNNVNFSWNPEEDQHERQQAAWYTKYQKLVDFYSKHGHLKVQNGSSLCTWLVNQRQRRAGKENHAGLTDEQIRLLDEIGFSWAPTGGPHEIAWHSKYQELAEFCKQHGHPNVMRPSSLYTWTVTQRQRRAGKGGCVPLTDEQIRLLDEIEFPWAPKQGPSPGSRTRSIGKAKTGSSSTSKISTVV